MPKLFQQSTIEATPRCPATHCQVSSLIPNSMNAITIINANLSFLSPHHSSSTTTFILPFVSFSRSQMCSWREPIWTQTCSRTRKVFVDRAVPHRGIVSVWWISISISVPIHSGQILYLHTDFYPFIYNNKKSKSKEGLWRFRNDRQRRSRSSTTLSSSFTSPFLQPPASSSSEFLALLSL
jgi:hypothetical protein